MQVIRLSPSNMSEIIQDQEYIYRDLEHEAGVGYLSVV